MNKNIFAEIYAKEEAQTEAFHTAQEAGDEAEMAKVREAHQQLMTEVEAHGKEFCRIYRLYTEAKEKENEYIDLHEVLWERDVAGFIESLRKWGIEKFTFSSGWSSAVETAWLFLENGCKLVGMTEVNGSKDYFKGGFEKLHGYIFSLN